jgi:hypothetical protein
MVLLSIDSVNSPRNKPSLIKASMLGLRGVIIFVKGFFRDYLCAKVRILGENKLIDCPWNIPYYFSL